MRPSFGQLAIVIGGWAILIALIVIAVVVIRKLVKYARRREADRREMLDLMREQNRRGNE